jgi:hypothetical protein
MYGQDRVFIHLRTAEAPDLAGNAHVERLERAGHPIVRIDWTDRYALGAEFYRWEFATAIAGAVLGVNPFDQPDVESAKLVTRRLAADYEHTGTLIDDEPPLREEDVAALLDQLKDGDYFALLAFIAMSQPHRNALEAIRTIVRDRRKVATTVGFGPRYLHSTGQAHKGGPNSGVFLLITADDSEDVPVPGQRYSGAGEFSACTLRMSRPGSASCMPSFSSYNEIIRAPARGTFKKEGIPCALESRRLSSVFSCLA